MQLSIFVEKLRKICSELGPYKNLASTVSQTGFVLLASVSGSHGEFDSRRRALFDALAQSQQIISTVAAQLRVSHAFDMHSWYVRPMFDLGAQRLHRDAIDETGAGANNLHVTAGNDTVVTLQPALEAGYDFAMHTNSIRLFARVGATQFVSGSNVAVSATFEGTPAGVAAFTASERIDKTLTDVSAGVDLLSVRGAVLRLGYTSQSSTHGSQHGGSMKMSIPF
jgi:outer membrane autotransporter protein